GAGRLDKLVELRGRARRQCDRHPGFGEGARQRSRKAGAGADDEGGCVAHYLTCTERTANTMPNRKLSSANSNRTIAAQRILSMVRAGKRSRCDSSVR